MHALIIEDDYLIGRALEDKLRELGFKSFSFARSEDAAIAAARELQPQLITADVRLLPGSGMDAVSAICTRRPCAVVFITGFAEEVRDRVPDAIVVQKPVEEKALRSAVTEALARAGAAGGQA